MAKLNTKKKILALAIASATYAGSASAIVVDGVVNPSDEYSAGTTLMLGWATENGQDSGEVEGTFHYFVEPGGLIYAAITAPTDFTDNVYGAPSTVADAGWGSGRDFSKLLGSDRLLFGLDFDGDGVNDMSVVIDYLAKDNGSGYDKLDLKGSDKGSDGGVINKPGTFVQGAEDTTQNTYRAVFGEFGGSVIQDVASSLEYNLSKGCGNTTDSADFSDPGLDAGCSALFTFEWSMTASAFNNTFSASNILKPLMHASPSKIHKNSIWEPGCMGNGNCPGGPPGGGEPPGVPEPGSLAVMLAGLVGLGWSRRRRKDKLPV